MIFNFIFGRHRKQDLRRKTGALADLARWRRGAIPSATWSSPLPVAEHLMNLGFVPGLEVTVATQQSGWRPPRLPGGRHRSRHAARPVPPHPCRIARGTSVWRLMHGSYDNELPCGCPAPG